MIKNNSCLDFTLPVTVPDTTEAFDKLAGKPNAALNEAISNVLYRSWNAEFRQTFLERMEKESQIAWPVDQAKTDAQDAPKDANKSKPTIYIPQGDYFKLLKAKGFTVEQMNPIAQDVASKIEFDPSASARGGGKIGKEFLAAADDMLADANRDKLATRLGKLESLNNIKIALDDEKDKTLPSRDTLARAIKTNTDRKYRIAQEQAASELDS